MATLNVSPYQYSTTQLKAVQDANRMQASVLSECVASGREPPPYQFSELIGKGSFGRVYKARQAGSGKLVAIKIINIEVQDADPGADAFSDMLKEIETLKLLGKAGARNINTVVDALLLGHWVWMITEYCAGGSVSTLMRPRGRLPEHWIIPILREVAEAVYWTHKQGVIHRDIKCANVLITETGGVQLCDFGVAAIVTTKFNKRSTFTGSLHWMAPELFNPTVQYGTEVDIWAFGSMAYEVASGLPPNAAFRDVSRFGTYLKHHHPQLEGDEHSPGLKDLISYCVVEDPTQRPVIEKVQLHPYIYNTSAMYPTVSLAKLVDVYKIWEAQGGSRLSLFAAGGAVGEPESRSQGHSANEWTFSTLDDLDQLSGQDSLQSVMDAYDTTIGPSSKQPRARRGRMPPPMKAPIAPLEKLFDPNTMTGYHSSSRLFYGEPGPPPAASDLPLRDNMETVRVRESLIDLDAALGPGPDIPMNRVTTSRSLDDEPTADRRMTLEWKFPTAPQSAGLEYELADEPHLAEFSTQGSDDAFSTFPADNRISTSSLIDLDASIPPLLEQTPYSRISTSSLIDLDASIPPLLEQTPYSLSVTPPQTTADRRGHMPSLIDIHASLPPEEMLIDSRPSTANSDSPSSFSEQTPFVLETHALGPALPPPTYASAASGSSGGRDNDESPFDAPSQQDRRADPDEDGMTVRAVSHRFHMPPRPSAPSADVLEGRASSEEVKEELLRLIGSLKDHLNFAGDTLGDLPT